MKEIFYAPNIVSQIRIADPNLNIMIPKWKELLGGDISIIERGGSITVRLKVNDSKINENKSVSK